MHACMDVSHYSRDDGLLEYEQQGKGKKKVYDR